MRSLGFEGTQQPIAFWLRQNDFLFHISANWQVVMERSSVDQQPPMANQTRKYLRFPIGGAAVNISNSHPATM